MAFIEKLARRNQDDLLHARRQVLFRSPAQPGQCRRVELSWGFGLVCASRPRPTRASRSPRSRVTDGRRSKARRDRRHGEARRRGGQRQKGRAARNARQRAVVRRPMKRADAGAQAGRGGRARQGDPRRTGPGLRDRQRRVHRHARDRPGHEHRAGRDGTWLQQDLLRLARPPTNSTAAVTAPRSRCRRRGRDGYSLQGATDEAEREAMDFCRASPAGVVTDNQDPDGSGARPRAAAVVDQGISQLLGADRSADGRRRTRHIFPSGNRRRGTRHRGER